MNMNIITLNKAKNHILVNGKGLRGLSQPNAPLNIGNNGTTTIKDASELKVKGTNRIDTVVTNLKAMGAQISATDDGMIIEGTGHLKGTNIDSYHDHRIAMSFVIAGLVADGETRIHNCRCVDISYHEFFETLRHITSKH